MRRNALIYVSLIGLISLLSSCEVIGGIFKAGVWVGVLIVVFILAVAIWLINKSKG